MTFPELFIACEERRDLAHAASHNMHESIDKLEKLDDEISELYLLEHRFLHDDTQRQFDHFNKLQDDFADLEYEAARTLEAEKTAVLERLSTAYEEIQEYLEHIYEKHTQIQAKFIVIEDQLTDYEMMMEELTFNLSMKFADLFDQCLDLAHQTRNLGIDTDNVFIEFDNEVENTMKPQAFQAFSDLDHSAKQLADSDIPEVSTKVIRSVDDAFDQLNRTVEDHSTYMNEALHDMFLHVMGYVDRDALSGLQDMFKKLNNEALVAMEQSAHRMLATFQNGSHVASAIKHWIPALMHVKETAHTVQESMDAAIG